MNNVGSGNVKIEQLNMKQFKKKYFDNYSDAEIWMLNTTVENDGVIRKEAGGTYYIFVDQSET